MREPWSNTPLSEREALERLDALLKVRIEEVEKGKTVSIPADEVFKTVLEVS